MSNHATENCRKFCKIFKTKTHWTKNCKKKEKQEANVAETNDPHHVAKMMFTFDLQEQNQESQSGMVNISPLRTSGKRDYLVLI